jgi:hypothetical protein
VQLGQKNAGGGVWTERCRSIWVEQENKWICIEKQCRIYWFTHKEHGGHHRLGSKNTLGESKPHFLENQRAAVLKYFQTPTPTTQSEFWHKMCLEYNKIFVSFMLKYLKNFYFFIWFSPWPPKKRIVLDLSMEVKLTEENEEKCVSKTSLGKI